jgi:hypothetical protein
VLNLPSHVPNGDVTPSQQIAMSNVNVSPSAIKNGHETAPPLMAVTVTDAKPEPVKSVKKPLMFKFEL